MADEQIFSLLPTDHLILPKEIHRGVTSPETYLLAQRVAILQKRVEFSNLNWRMPFEWEGALVLLKVSDSHWQLVCGCGNTPAYDPGWQLACCFTCGAIYKQAPPDNWREIERVLVNRSSFIHRHMLPGQTVEELRAENRAHGDPD